MPEGPDWIFYCDEWIGVSLDTKLSFNEAIDNWEGIHGIQARAKRVFIFGSHYDTSVE